MLANEDKMHFAEEASKGGPLGELVQWSDIITSLYILGHDITVTADFPSVQRSVMMLDFLLPHFLQSCEI